MLIMGSSLELDQIAFNISTMQTLRSSSWRFGTYTQATNLRARAVRFAFEKKKKSKRYLMSMSFCQQLHECSPDI